jgi:hypothetical protein
LQHRVGTPTEQVDSEERRKLGMVALKNPSEEFPHTLTAIRMRESGSAERPSRMARAGEPKVRPYSYGVNVSDRQMLNRLNRDYSESVLS